jgi:hypothetical protein
MKLSKPAATPTRDLARPEVMPVMYASLARPVVVTLVFCSACANALSVVIKEITTVRITGTMNEIALLILYTVSEKI